MSTQAQLAVSYDVSNDFFRLWLDERMNYSCALFQKEDDSLEQAQFNKLKWHHAAARVSPESRVLDIGCGWGANLEFLSKDMKVKDAVGITLSRAQYNEIKQRALPGVTTHCISYTDFEPTQLFDSIISIGMFEHLATPEQARANEHIKIYRDYFHRAWKWTRPGSWFALQSVIGGRVPRGRDALQEIGWATYNIFPGAITPRLEAIISSVSPYWEVIEVHTRREHYEKTTAHWLQRLQKNEAIISKRWSEELFEEYQRYLSACMMAFAEGYQSLVQIALRRID